jgi:hypothetical protein
VGLDPARWHHRRLAPSRRIHFLNIYPIYTFFGSTSTTTYPCHVGKRYQYNLAVFHSSRRPNYSSATLFFLFLNSLTTLVSQSLDLSCTYRRCPRYKKPRKTSVRGSFLCGISARTFPCDSPFSHFSFVFPFAPPFSTTQPSL